MVELTFFTHAEILSASVTYGFTGSGQSTGAGQSSDLVLHL